MSFMPASAGPKPVWRWPPAIMTMRDLFAAMRDGFDLQVRYTERGGSVYSLSREGIEAPVGILQQDICHRAFRLGKFGHPIPCGDDRWLLKLTTKSAA